MNAPLKYLLCLAPWLLSAPLIAQPMRDAVSDPNTPTYADVRPQPTAQLQAQVSEMRRLLQVLRRSDLPPAQKQAVLDKLLQDWRDILQQHNTWIDWQKPQTIDSAALLLESMTFEIAAEDIAPDKQSREQVLHDAMRHLALDPNQPAEAERYEPPLQAPVVTGADASTETSMAAKAAPDKDPGSSEENAPTAVGSPPATTGSDNASQIEVSDKVKVAVLADDTATTDMHDDNSVLRNVTDEDGHILLFGTMRLWIGGAVQLDAYAAGGLFTLAEGGNSESELYVRRGEGILRASVFENSEMKVQYDFDADIFHNLYWRWLSHSTSRSVTIGNQKEPIGQDYLVGSKFTTAMEPSAPSTAFASFRSKGIRYSSWNALEPDENPYHLWGDSRTYVTGSIGLFGEDLENTNDTDWAVTGRTSIGARPTEDKGYHLALAGTYRHGEFDRIAPRPGLHDANRILLARQDADTQAMLALEGMANLGSLHGQAEAYYSDYSGGDIDADGWGGYGQISWLFNGKRRIYQPRRGVSAPINAAHSHVFEVFGRLSLTHGNDNENSSNELRMLTIGGSWYYRNFRASANLIYADTERDVADEGNGHGLGVRLQYLF